MPFDMDWSAIFSPFNITLAILAFSAIFFMSGKVRSDIVALCSLIALMLFGILNPSEALAGFSNSVVIMMVGLFIVGAGIFRTGLARMISSKILQLGGRNENLLFVLVMLVTAFIGAFVSNTGTVALMMPIVMSMTAKGNLSSRRYLMPMAFASSMGMFTLISTPPNLVIQDALTGAGHKALSFFSFAPVGAIAVLVGVGILFFLSKWLLGQKKDQTEGGEKKGKSLAELVEQYNLSQQTYQISVPAGSPLIGGRLDELNIRSNFGVNIGKVVGKPAGGRFRKTAVEEIAGPATVIREGDMLLCNGSTEKIGRFVEENALKFEQKPPNDESLQFDEYGVAEIFIMPNSTLINKTIAESRFREKYNVNVLGIQRQGEYDTDSIKDLKIHAGDALLIQGRWDDISALDNRQSDMVLVGQPEKEAAKATLDRKAPMAAAIMIAMIAVMVLEIIPAVAAVLLAALLMVLTGCLRNMEEAYNSINWSSIVLIGSMIPMATAFEKTGVTAVISDWMLGFGNMGPHGLLILVYGCTSLLTLILSNTATAVLFAPIAMQAAAGAGVSPYPFLFAVAVAASMCFASPFSTPPNALVMSAGRYSFMDYVKVGLPLQLIMGVVMVLMLPLLFPFS